MDEASDWVGERDPEHDERERDIATIKSWLRLARVSRGLSVDTAAAKLKVATSDITSWEDESLLDVPSSEQLSAFSRKLNVLLPWHDWSDAQSSTHRELPQRPHTKPDFSLLVEGIELRDRRSIKLWVRSARKRAKLTQGDLAEILNVSKALIARWEIASSRDIPTNDTLAEMARMCRVPNPSAPPNIRKFLKAQEQKYAQEEVDEGATEECPDPESLLDEIKAVARRLVSATWSDANRTRNAEIFALYYGYGKTLEEIGSQYGLTRERVRQVIARMVDNTVGRKLPLAFFDALVEQSATLELCSIGVAEHTLAEALGSVRLEDAMQYGAHVLGKNLPLEINRQICDCPIVVPRGQSNWASVAISYSRRMIRRNGAALLDLVWAYIARTNDPAISQDAVTAILNGVDGFSWLGEGQSWFWFGPDDGANRMVDWTRRILATAGRKVDIEHILAGIARDNRSDREERDVVMLLPPAIVLQELLASYPDIETIQHDDLILTTTDYVPFGEAGSSGETVLDLLRDNGGVMNKYDLQHTSTGEKINPVTLNVVLSRFPLITQIDHGIYAIRGARLSGEAIHRAYRPQLNSNGHFNQKPVSINEDGLVCWNVELTSGAITNRQMNLPAEARRYLDMGTYHVIDGGTIELSDDGKNQHVRGAVRELLAMGGQTGDRFAVMFNPKNRTVRLEPIGNQ